MNEKKILLHLPNDLKERLLCFPVLHTLHKLNPEAEFHIATAKKGADIFSLLPLKSTFHELPEEAELSKLEAFREGRVSRSLYDIDLLFSFVPTTTAPIFATAVEAKKKFGYETGWTKILWSKSAIYQKHLHPTANHYRILSLYTNRSHEEEEDAFGVEQAPLLDNWSDRPYVIINLSIDEQQQIKPFWAGLLEMIKLEHIFITCDQWNEEAEGKFFIEKFLQENGLTGDFTIFNFLSWKEMARLILFAKIVVSENTSIAHLTSYMGTPLSLLMNASKAQLTAPLFMGGRVLLADSIEQVVDQHLAKYFTSKN